MAFVPLQETPITGESAEGAYGADKDGILAHIYWRPVQDKHESEITGHPVFKSVPYVKIVIPGDHLTKVDCELKDEHKERWPHVWKAFSEKREGVIDGTPINEWSYLTASQVAMFKAMGIVTVEMLAGLSDSKLSMHITREMRDRAQQFCKSSPAVEKELRERNAELEKEIAKLAAQMKSLEATMARIPKDAPQASKAA